MTMLQQAFRFHAATTVGPQRQNLVIEAGAGTGKTSAIVAEVLSILLENEDLSPERIVLMTFTEKAAGEIADRIHHALAELEMQFDGDRVIWPPDSAHPLFEVPPDRKDAYRRACEKQLARVDSIRSQTIHSFCQSLLRAYPIEAGLDPQFKIIEGFERSLLLGRLYDEWVDEETRVHPTNTALQEWEFLLAHFGYLFQIRKQIFDLLDRRDLLVDGRPFDDDDCLTAIVEPQIVGAIDAIRRNAAESAALHFRYIRETPPPPRGSVEAWIDYFAPIAHEIETANVPAQRDLKEALMALRTDRSKGSSIHERLVRHRSAIALHSLTRRFIDFLDREKRTLGVADFDDLLLRTHALLQNGEVAGRIRAQFDFIFVDEFQDTDRTQARIIERLACDASGRWIPGKTVVVGDPKQSIYGFRRADPETYRNMTNAMVSAGAEHRVLETQYRSTPALLDAINTMFTRLFGAGDSNVNVFRPPYHALKTSEPSPRGRGHAEGGVRGPSPGASRHPLPPGEGTPITFLHSRHADSSERHLVEAEAIASFITEQRDGSERDLQRFAILFRRLTHIDDYLDVFDRTGIEYVLPSTKAFLERRAPVDLVAVLRAIAFPFDRGAEVSAARTPYFALTDDEVTEGMLGERESAAWSAYQRALAVYRDRSRHLTVAGTIDLLVTSSRIEEVYREIPDAKRAARHLERVRAIAFEYDLKIGGSLRDFVEEIDRRREDPDEMEPSLADDDSNAVRILTVHAAKGLEFETVILPDLVFKTKNGGDGAEIYDVEDPRYLIMTGRAQSLSAHYRYTPTGTRLKSVLGEREEAEGRRLFYVAATRAKREVVFACNTAAYRNDGFMACLQSIFGFEKDTFDALWEEKPEMINGIAVRFCVAAPTRRRTDEDRRRVGGAPLHPAEIFTPSPEPQPSRTYRGNRTAGILLHRFLELWDGVAPAEKLLDALAREAAADADTVTRVRKRIENLRTSENFRRISAATTVGREVVIRFGAEERRIDRLLAEEGRDVVVDYKSGAPAEADREQIARYCRAVEAMTGRPCEGLLWYIDADSDELVRVP